MESSACFNDDEFSVSCSLVWAGKAAHLSYSQLTPKEQVGDGSNVLQSEAGQRHVCRQLASGDVSQRSPTITSQCFHGVGDARGSNSCCTASELPGQITSLGSIVLPLWMCHF